MKKSSIFKILLIFPILYLAPHILNALFMFALSSERTNLFGMLGESFRTLSLENMFQIDFFIILGIVIIRPKKNSNVVNLLRKTKTKRNLVATFEESDLKKLIESLDNSRDVLLSGAGIKKENFPQLYKWTQRAGKPFNELRKILKEIEKQEGKVYYSDRENMAKAIDGFIAYLQEVNQIRITNNLITQLDFMSLKLTLTNLIITFLEIKKGLYGQTTDSIKEDEKEKPVNYDIFSEEYLSDDRDIGYKFEMLDMIDEDTDEFL